MPEDDSTSDDGDDSSEIRSVSRPTNRGPKNMPAVISPDFDDMVSDSDEDDRMFVVEIRGDIYSSNQLTETLNAELHRFGSIDTLTYVRSNDTGEQRELIEKLGIEWDPRYMPWLLILDSPPNDIQQGDRALNLKLGKLDGEGDVQQVLDAIIKASNESDFMREIVWENRKQEIVKRLPALRESAKFAISIVGIV